jgi:hypothetical protein
VSTEREVKKSTSRSKKDGELEDNYEDDFDEDIDEELPERDDLEDSGDKIGKIGESHGVTVSQSLGIDPSVDSLALEEYDHVEPIEKVNQ